MVTKIAQSETVILKSPIKKPTNPEMRNNSPFNAQIKRGKNREKGVKDKQKEKEKLEVVIKR